MLRLLQSLWWLLMLVLVFLFVVVLVSVIHVFFSNLKKNFF